MSEPVVAIVVAAGSGVRLGWTLPKALVPLAGSSLVRRSADALVLGGVTHLVVVVPADHEQAFHRELGSLPVPWMTTTGGTRRQDSVAAGLAAIGQWDSLSGDPAGRDIVSGDTVILVHDAARPLVPAGVVRRVIEAVRQGHPAVVPAVAVVDTIREVDGDDSHVVDRSRLRAVQTPQGFTARVLGEAHAALTTDGVEVTDDAAACQRQGHPVTLVEGSPDALKVTMAVDLVLAEAILARRPGPS